MGHTSLPVSGFWVVQIEEVAGAGKGKPSLMSVREASTMNGPILKIGKKGGNVLTALDRFKV